MKYKIFAADFETSYENKTAWVWAWGVCELNSIEPIYGNSIKSFMEYILTAKYNSKIYFHNEKFDSKFILHYLLSNGWEMVTEIKNEKQFSALIDDKGTIYSLNIEYYISSKKYKLQILDSYKIFSYSLAECARQFKLPIQKGELDYDKIRYEGHQLTEIEKEYLRKDVLILANMLSIAKDTKLLNKITIASTSMSEYKDWLKNNGIDFRKIFPMLNIDETDDLRKYYRGGISFLKREYEGKITHMHSYDVNSEYPFVMCERSFPYGKPRYFKGKYKYDTIYTKYVQHIKCEFYIRKNKLPFIQLKGHTDFYYNEFVENCPILSDIYLTDVELKLFLESYDTINLKYIDGYKFRESDKLFKGFVKPLYDIKSNTDNVVEKFTTKIRINSFYGKFALKGMRKSLLLELKDDILHNKEYIDTFVEELYLPVAIFTTAYARVYLCENANKNYDKFIYCDTDSLHLTAEGDLPIDNKKLGYFKHEYSGTGKYLKQKCYYIDYDNEYCYINTEGEYITNKITCAGLNKNLLGKLTINDFNYGSEFQKLRLTNVKGGCALLKVPHIITPPKHSPLNEVIK